MAALTLTIKLMNILEKLISCDSYQDDYELISNEEKQLIINNMNKNYIEIKNLPIVMKYLNYLKINDTPDHITPTLKSCLLNCKIVILKKESELSDSLIEENNENNMENVKKQKELQKRREYLTIKSETREYNRMVFGTERLVISRFITYITYIYKMLYQNVIRIHYNIYIIHYTISDI